ncbi:cytochrome P450 [Dentipellis sp. KUC8613]|nr:cytochrome P450 [Dentipellis sp. KUC8613]
MLSDIPHALPLGIISPAYFVSFSCLALVVLVYYHRQSSGKNAKLPPGPRGYPFIGNLLEIIKTKQFPLLFPEWSRVYGNMVQFTVLGARFIVVADYNVAVDLLEKRSAIYSDRPPAVLLTELGGWGKAMSGLQYGPLFRKHRRMSQTHLNSNAVRGYGDLHNELASGLLSSLAAKPEKFMDHIFMYAASTVFRIAYDLDIETPERRHLVDTANDAVDKANKAFTKSAVVNFFPPMKWLYILYPEWAPFSGFKKEVVALRKQTERSMNIPYNMVKDNMRDGSAGPSLVHDAIENIGRLAHVEKEDEEDICGLAGILFAAGQETTVTVLNSFVLAMVLNPEVQRKAQEEIDAIIPPDRVPTLDDYRDLPYIAAVIKEVYRWLVPVPNGLPHAVMEDDTYNGYFIPKGTVILTSLNQMCNACPRPTEFLPHRFIDGTDRGSVPADPGDVVFGFGRRRCPGMWVANNSIWTAVAQMLSSFEFLPEIVDGKECPPPALFEEATSRHPVPFRCRILPRKDRQFPTFLNDPLVREPEQGRSCL